MRWYILRTLLHKEVLRHLANRGGIVLAVLLVVMSMLLSFFGTNDVRTGALGGGVQRCYIHYWEDGPWIDHLRRTVPDELRAQVRFRTLSPEEIQGALIQYPFNTAAIQLRVARDSAQGPRYKVWFWYPGKDRSVLAPFEAWFWRETHHFYQQQAAAAAEQLGPETRAALPLPNMAEEWSSLTGGLDPRAALATALVLFAIFFVCVYLLPSLTCEERERGILLAQALSPATPREILAAKFLFYPVLAVGLGAILAGTYRPAVLLQPLFWLTLGTAAFGSLGIGLTIASLARTQRAASMGALCYMLVVAVLLFICQQNNIPGLPYLALEYHVPRMLHAILGGMAAWYHWWQLLVVFVLAYGWAALATVLFRQRGWQ